MSAIRCYDDEGTSSGLTNLNYEGAKIVKIHRIFDKVFGKLLLTLRPFSPAGDVYCRCVFRQVADALEVETLSRAVTHQQPGAGEMGNAGNG